MLKPEILSTLREEYPEECHVELVKMVDEPRKDMTPGLKGTVLYVDSMGDVHVDWENGSSLAAVYGVDVIRRM